MIKVVGKTRLGEKFTVNVLGNHHREVCLVDFFRVEVLVLGVAVLSAKKKTPHNQHPRWGLLSKFLDQN